MKANAFDVAEFYEQLRLLVQADMPLPGSLRQLAGHMRGRRWAEVVRAMSERASRGEQLSRIMMSFPHYFEPLHIRLVSAGEKSGTLPDTLHMVASYSRFSQLLADRLREILVYPLINIHLGLLVGLLFAGLIVPRFSMFYGDYGDVMRWDSTPFLTRMVFAVGMIVHQHFYIAVAAYVVLLGFSVWIFLPGVRPQKTLIAMINAGPWSGGLAEAQDMARLCSLLSMFMWQKMPMTEALASSSQLVLGDELGAALGRASLSVSSGRKITDSLEAEQAVNPMVSLTLQRTPEESLPITMAQLGEMFEQNAIRAARQTTAIWTAAMTILMALIVGTVIIAMFQPLASIITRLGQM